MSPNPLEIRQVAVGGWQENCYLLCDPQANEAILFDPGAEIEKIEAMIGDCDVVMILLTHAHHDHVGAVEALRARSGAPVMIHAAELPMLGTIPYDTTLAGDQHIAWGDHLIRTAHTPGHTPGMLTFLVDDIAIVGDTIFAGGPGHTTSHEDFLTTLDTLRDVVLTWPDSLRCYPGHGESFRLGDKRDAIAAFVARDHPDGFHGDAEW